MRMLAVALMMAALVLRAGAQAGSDGPPAPLPPVAPAPPAVPAAGGDGPPAAVAPVETGPPSAVSSPAETAPPSVVVMTPAAESQVSDTVAVSANAADNVGVASVQFLLDGAGFGVPLTSAPYTFRWDTRATPDGPHSLAAIAVDLSGNAATSPVVRLAVDNTPPVLKDVTAVASGRGTAVVRWKTDERADSRVEYGTTTAYGQTAVLNASPRVEHGASLTGLVPGAPYHYRASSRDPAGNLAVSADAVFVASSGAGGPGALSEPAASDDAAAKAPQKLLTPSRADGINDAATFGPEAREVSVFDVRGRRVFHATSDGPGAPIVWNARDGAGRVLESGIYIATIIKRDGGRTGQSFTIAK